MKFSVLTLGVMFIILFSATSYAHEKNSKKIVISINNGHQNDNKKHIPEKKHKPVKKHTPVKKHEPIKKHPQVIKHEQLKRYNH